MRLNSLILSKFPLKKFSPSNCERKHFAIFLIVFWHNKFSNISTVEQIRCIRSLVTFVENELHFEPRLFKTFSRLVQTPATVCSQLIDNFVESFIYLKVFNSQ